MSGMSPREGERAGGKGRKEEGFPIILFLLPPVKENLHFLLLCCIVIRRNSKERVSRGRGLSAFEKAFSPHDLQSCPRTCPSERLRNGKDGKVNRNAGSRGKTEKAAETDQRRNQRCIKDVSDPDEKKKNSPFPSECSSSPPSAVFSCGFG